MVSGPKVQVWLELCMTHEEHFHLHWCGGNWNGIEDSNRPHPLRMTKEGPLWHFSSLPISLHHINEVISGGVTAQSDVGVVDLVLGQDTLNSFTIQLRLCTLKRERGEDRQDVNQHERVGQWKQKHILNSSLMGHFHIVQFTSCFKYSIMKCISKTI